jgi:hypothetical protein
MMHADHKPSLLIETFPELAEELQQLLGSSGESTLADQVAGLRILDRCRCGDDFCATFYVQPKPAGSYGPGLRTVPLEPNKGMLIIDVVDGTIATVEALYRNNIRQMLLALFP